MGWLAKRGGLKASTIDGYSSAVSTWHKWGTLSDSVDIGNSTAVSLVRAGIHKALKPAERKAERADPLTPAVLQAIVAAAPGTGPRALMIIAAASVGIYGTLRPNELLGSHQNRDRALTTDRITFWADAQSLVACPVGKGLRAQGPVPHHFTIELGRTKADPTAAAGGKDIAAAPAVAALWNWLHMRKDLRPPGANAHVFIFERDGRWNLLSTAEMMRQLSGWAQKAGLARHRFAGKSMRQGGAKALMESGAPIPDIMQQGRWATPSMTTLYAGPDAVRMRRLLVSKSMEPVSATQGAGP